MALLVVVGVAARVGKRSGLDSIMKGVCVLCFFFFLSFLEKKKEKEKEGISQGIQLSERTGSERLGRRRRRRYIRTSGDMGEEETEREKERMEGWASYRTRLWESVVIRPVISSARWCRRETMAGKYSYREQQSHGWQQQQQEPQKERKEEEEEPTWVNYQTGLSFWWEKERVRRNIFLSFPSTGTLYLYIYIS